MVSLRRDVTPGAGISLEGLCEGFALSEAMKTGLKLGFTKKGSHDAFFYMLNQVPNPFTK